MYISTSIKKAARLLEKKANELLKPHNLRHAYTYFLLELYKKDGMTQSELHQCIGIEQPTAVRTLDRMERDGFIYRKQSVTDRRVLHIHLTEKGYSSKSYLLEAADNLNHYLLKGLSENEVSALKNLLAHLHKNLESGKT